MKKTLLFCLGSLALATVATSQELTRVSIRTQGAAALAAELETEGFDILEGTVTGRSFEAIVSPESMGLLIARGYAPQILEVGRPFYEIQAERSVGQTAPQGPGENRMPPPAGYSDLAGIYAQMQAIAAAAPSICEFVDLTARYGTPKTVQNRSFFALKISDNVATDEDEPATLIVADHHAREIGTPVVALHAASELTTKYGVDPAITAIVNGNEIWIAPVWNPDGYNYVFTTNNLWRKNRRVFAGGTGVDLNRNYPFGWTAPCSGSSNASSDTYKGPSAGSEAATMTMMTWSEAERFAKVIDYHSFGRETLWEYACNPHPLSTYLRTEAIGLSQASGYGNAQRGPSAEGEHYEWQLATYGAQAFLIEISTAFQPSFASAQNEAAQLFGGIQYMLERDIPMTGIVTDAITGLPVSASLNFQALNYQNGETNTSDPQTGRYSAFLPAGTYIGSLKAPGYRDTCFVVRVEDNQTTVKDMTIMPLSGCPTASVTHRIGPGNPDTYTVTPAVIGQSSTFTVNTQGFQFATIFAVLCPDLRGADFGTLLIQVDSAPFFTLGPLAGPVAQTSVVVTNDASLCGLTVYTQAKLHNVAKRPIVVTNAQDLLIGN